MNIFMTAAATSQGFVLYTRDNIFQVTALSLSATLFLTLLHSLSLALVSRV